MPDRPPVIAPVPGSERPLWSVMIPVYNCARYLPYTLQSVLQQDAGAYHMQIEVVDDASTDSDIEALVAQVGGGRIAYYRQPHNVGSLKNFETCLNRSRGRLIHLLHGDDAVHNGYYKKMEALLTRFPEAGAAFCRYAYINEANEWLQHPTAEATEDGLLKNWLLRIAQRQRIQYCAITVKRHVYEELGGFYGVSYGEDWEMWTRLAAQYPVAYTPDVLADYRRHESSITGQAFLSGQNLRDLQWVIEKMQTYLPQSIKGKAKKEASRFYAHYGATTANRLWQEGRDKKGAVAQMREALRMHHGRRLYWRLAKLCTRMALNIR
ncbi:MAG TPA: glycosyltransferase [Chitinophagaceae bacterium]|nr:glycosyltransferase [Chitinophagaceae bacterium]